MSGKRVRLLVVDDDAGVCELLRSGLVDDGYDIDVVHSGDEAIERAFAIEYDAIVLDVTLPGADGFEVCRRLRNSKCWAPVLMLSARMEVADRVRGLDSGADDYLMKPFYFEELSARLRTLLRKPMPERPTILRAGDLTLDPASHVVMRGPSEVVITLREFALLEFLMRRVGQSFTRDELFHHVWSHPGCRASNVVDQCVSYLRRRIDKPFGVSQLETLRGVGYRLRPAPVPMDDDRENSGPR
jgi:two-component system OmpR family response regulator